MSKKIKLQIDALPCRSDAFSYWFWEMIMCAILGGILGYFCKTELPSPSLIHDISPTVRVLIFLIPVLAVPGFMFNLIFARGCRAVSSSLYQLWLAMAVISLAQSLLTAIALATGVNLTIVSGLLNLSVFVLYIIVTVKLCSTYSGTLGRLGKSFWLVPLLCVAAVLVALLLGVLFVSIDSELDILGSIILFLAIIYCVYLLYAKILRVMYDLLQDGYAVALTEDDMADYIASKLSGENISYSESTAAESLGMDTEEKENATGNMATTSADSGKNMRRIGIIIAICSAVVLAALVVIFCISKYGHKPSEEDYYQDEYDEWMDEEAEEIGIEDEYSDNEVENPEVEESHDRYHGDTDMLDHILYLGEHNDAKSETEYRFSGDFLYKDRKWPIAVTFIEKDNNPGVIRTAQYKNISAKAELKLAVVVGECEIRMTSNDNGKNFDIHLTDADADNLYGTARWGDTETKVVLRKTDNY